MLLSLGLSAYDKMILDEGGLDERFVLGESGRIEKSPKYNSCKSLAENTSLRFSVFEVDQLVLEIVAEMFVTIASISSVLVL